MGGMKVSALRNAPLLAARTTCFFLATIRCDAPNGSSFGEALSTRRPIMEIFELSTPEDCAHPELRERAATRGAPDGPEILVGCPDDHFPCRGLLVTMHNRQRRKTDITRRNALEFGIQFFPSVGPDDKPADRYWSEALYLTQVAERLGYTSVRTVIIFIPMAVIAPTLWSS